MSLLMIALQICLWSGGESWHVRGRELRCGQSRVGDWRMVQGTGSKWVYEDKNTGWCIYIPILYSSLLCEILNIACNCYLSVLWDISLLSHIHVGYQIFVKYLNLLSCMVILWVCHVCLIYLIQVCIYIYYCFKYMVIVVYLDSLYVACDVDQIDL